MAIMENGLLKNSFHTHTKRCKHAFGNVEDYVNYAIELNYQEIGFTDHVPFPDNRLANIRMDYLELEEYLTEI